MKKTIITAALLAFLIGGAYSASFAETHTAIVKSEIVAGDNWDKILDEYESYVDQYIKVYKKAMNGDQKALNEYVKLLEKAQKLAEKLKDAEDDLTEAQLKRYYKITNKMINALSE